MHIIRMQFSDTYRTEEYGFIYTYADYVTSSQLLNIRWL